MTDEPMPAHLSDDDASAVVDGAASAETTTHLERCAECRARVARLRRAAAAIGAPVPGPSEAARETAIARALAAGQGPGARQWYQRPALLAAAAAIVAVLVAVPVLIGTRDGDGDDTTGAALGTSDSEVTAGADFVDGGDLGSIDDESALRQTLGARLSGGGTANASAAEGQASAGPPPTGDELAGDEFTAAPAGGGARTARAPDCTEAAVEALGGGVGAPRYSARLRWKGAAAQVLVFDAPADRRNLPYLVAVMSAVDCQLLVFQSF